MFRQKYYIKRDESIIVDGHKLYRIVAVRNFGGIVKSGQKGGWIENESNLSHKGFCWVADEAKVYGDAEITDNAIVSEEARVCSKAKVLIQGKLFDDARCNWTPVATKVCGDSTVSGHATVNGMTMCYNSHLRDNAVLTGYARVWNSTVCDNAKVRDWANVSNAYIGEDAQVGERARIDGGTNPDVGPFGIKYPTTKIHGAAVISGDAGVFGGAEVFGQARVNGQASVHHNCVVTGEAWLHGKVELFNKRIDAGEYSKGKIFAFGCF